MSEMMSTAPFWMMFCLAVLIVFVMVAAYFGARAARSDT